MSNKKSNVFRILQTILSAMLGVQSRKNMEKDFTTGKIQHYVIAGIITVILVILILYNLVKYISS